MDSKYEFKKYIMSGNKDDYVSNEALSYLKRNAKYYVVNKSALDASGENMSKIISISTSGQEYDDGELIENVQEKLTDGMRDIQKRDLIFDDNTPTKIAIWRHGSGYSAFAEV